MMEKHTQQNDQDDVNSSENIVDKARIKKYPRLPCRACIASCKNYERCDGKLWRMAK
mgnify:CR=1 FL=1